MYTLLAMSDIPCKILFICFTLLLVIKFDTVPTDIISAFWFRYS